MHYLACTNTVGLMRFCSPMKPYSRPINIFIFWQVQLNCQLHSTNIKVSGKLYEFNSKICQMVPFQHLKIILHRKYVKYNTKLVPLCSLLYLPSDEPKCTSLAHISVDLPHLPMLYEIANLCLGISYRLSAPVFGFRGSHKHPTSLPYIWASHIAVSVYYRM